MANSSHPMSSMFWITSFIQLIPFATPVLVEHPCNKARGFESYSSFPQAHSMTKKVFHNPPCLLDGIEHIWTGYFNLFVEGQHVINVKIRPTSFLREYYSLNVVSNQHLPRLISLSRFVNPFNNKRNTLRFQIFQSKLPNSLLLVHHSQQVSCFFLVPFPSDQRKSLIIFRI